MSSENVRKPTPQEHLNAIAARIDARIEALAEQDRRANAPRLHSLRPVAPPAPPPAPQAPPTEAEPEHLAESEAEEQLAADKSELQSGTYEPDPQFERELQAMVMQNVAEFASTAPTPSEPPPSAPPAPEPPVVAVEPEPPVAAPEPALHWTAPPQEPTPVVAIAPAEPEVEAEVEPVVAVGPAAPEGEPDVDDAPDAPEVEVEPVSDDAPAEAEAAPSIAEVAPVAAAAAAAAATVATAAAPPPPPPPEVPQPLVVAKDPPRRGGVIAWLALLLALGALGASAYQNYLLKGALDTSQRNLDLLERSGTRGTFMSACREVGEAYVDIKPRISPLMPAADRFNVVGASRITETHKLEAQAAIAKLTGLGPYLAAFQDAAARARFVELTRQLSSIVDAARSTPLTEIDKLFEPADKTFAAVSEDCARLIRAARN